MRRFLHIYKAYIILNWKINMEYRVDMLLGLFGISILNVVDIALIGIILNRFESIGGWTVWEIVFLTFFYVLVLGIENMFAVHLLDIENYIRMGTFDRFLIRPVPPLLQLLGQELTLRYLDHLILGGIGIGVAYMNLGLSWTLTQWFLFFVTLISSAILLGALVLTLCSFAFWTIRSSPFVFSTMELQEVIQHYPIPIFGRPFVLFVTFFLPFAFMNYYPTLALLSKEGEAIHPMLPYATPLMAFLFSVIATIVWRLGLNRYQSTGT